MNIDSNRTQLHFSHKTATNTAWKSAQQGKNAKYWAKAQVRVAWVLEEKKKKTLHFIAGFLPRGLSKRETAHSLVKFL